MKHKKSGYDDVLFYLSIAAMVILIYSVSFLPFGSLLQNFLFFIGAVILFASATAGKQRVIQALEIIIIVGIVLQLLRLDVMYSLAIVLFVSLLIVLYLLRIEHYKKEPIGYVGSVGFVLLAIGFAFNTGTYILVSGFSLAIGSLLIALYSVTSYMLYRVRLQVVIAVLNIVFAISTLLLILPSIGF